MNDSTLKSGSSLQGGKYIISSVLGQGGFGITYEAEQVSLGRKVAVKEFFMKDSCERDESTSYVTVPTASNRDIVSKFRDKFLREARMIAALDHDHIVKIHDVFEENGTAYYVMEYLGGGCLGDGVKAGKAMPEREAVESIRQIAYALEYLHNKGIIHFDVKPSNVLKTEDGKLKLIDFGISKHYDESGVQTSSTPVGISKGYAPLEQYQQGSDIKSFTPATDIYSLGATLYALLSGNNPPEASIVNEDGIPVINGVSPDVMQAIEKAMRPRRKERPQSVKEFLALLDGTAIEDDEDEGTFFSRVEAPSNITKYGKEEMSAESENTKKQQKLKESKEQEKNHFPKWLYGLLAGVAVLVLIVLLIRSGKVDITDRSQTYKHVDHEFVDLGLSVKWATCNIGANKPEEYGDYYAWAETTPKDEYYWDTLKYCDDPNSSILHFSKYNKEDNKFVLDVTDDAASVIWGGTWRIPTQEEFKELVAKCVWSITTINGIIGYKVTSVINGNSIFLPSTGYRNGKELKYEGSRGFYSTSSRDEDFIESSVVLFFDTTNDNDIDIIMCLRSIGVSIRPVQP